MTGELGGEGGRTRRQVALKGEEQPKTDSLNGSSLLGRSVANAGVKSPTRIDFIQARPEDRASKSLSRTQSMQLAPGRQGVQGPSTVQSKKPLSPDRARRASSMPLKVTLADFDAQDPHTTECLEKLDNLTSYLESTFSRASQQGYLLQSDIFLSGAKSMITEVGRLLAVDRRRRVKDRLELRLGVASSFRSLSLLRAQFAYWQQLLFPSQRLCVRRRVKFLSRMRARRRLQLCVQALRDELAVKRAVEQMAQEVATVGLSSWVLTWRANAMTRRQSEYDQCYKWVARQCMCMKKGLCLSPGSAGMVR
ncbi:hypothetical protein GUITHDRAFT_99087 [Guillardia theta CCMP2712]|uniref:Uncharacterized protein n=1 Tax=Guillardia theta (strain CCMP2712) TaxID=905079 RepID=L1K421_GUITC|nr:hypothetical protein GUITHDRAFT_99087 [Guillardia theta CCMP2712]EKX55307.1 hypothetical protein GUITHDRAFT_99087 [Guillardia theta CCMP2712]|eukprot:XP_005842287.1 hypothetical protein GUITHDRAFT_99087 [Guillardia theta CCMP2712]